MKAQVFGALLVMMVSLFILGGLYPLFNDIVVNYAIPEMQDANVSTAFVQNFRAIFSSLPFVYLFLLFLWVYIFIHREDVDARFR